ncbi:rhomboid family intramembrane serine protease [Vampirovibrio sp.]|uniref:rhomboid family intramembrane serine protease n=1 Tax=Vampirovibrio sp. TaxID=2717857 RepID=UPI0035938FF5
MESTRPEGPYPPHQEETPVIPEMEAGNPQASFIRRCPLTVGFVLLVSLIYGLSSYGNGFQYPAKLWVLLGGFYPPFVQNGEWWRYITASLLHGTPAHWFNNIAGLLIFGNLLEPVIGSWPLLGIYLISSFGGLWLSSLMLPNGMTYGASTIDYGLIGAYITLMLLIRLQLDKQAFFKELRGSIVLTLMFVLWNSMESATVNLWGHVGGLVGGILCMLALWSLRNKKAALP